MSSPSADPSGFLRGNVVVKIVETARDDLNGLLGFCTAYNKDRERYMVRLSAPSSTPSATGTSSSSTTTTTTTVTVVALRASNLTEASKLESYKARFQQLATDPMLRRQLSEYYQTASAACQSVGHGVLGPAATTNPTLLALFRPEYCAAAVLLLLLVAIVSLGLTRTLLLLSCTALVAVLLVEDVVRRRRPWREVAANFPGRCNTVLSHQFAVLRGKLNDSVAAALVVVLLAFAVRSLFLAGGSTGNSGSSSTSTSSASVNAGANHRVPQPQRMLQRPPEIDREVLEEFYNLGFRDSLDGKDRGHSFAQELEQLLRASTSNSGQHDLDFVPYHSTTRTHNPHELPNLPVSPSSNKTFLQRLVSVRTAGSLFYLYRMATQIGVNPSTGLFDAAQLVATLNSSNMPIWQKGMLAFSCYNLVANLFF